VALDATPLLGARTGVAEFCLGALGALVDLGDLDVSAFAISWRRRHRLPPVVPPGVRVASRAMPARPLHLAWRLAGIPPVEWFTGRTDVVHGTNYVVPPTRRAARVVTVHDLTVVRFPELCDGPTLVFRELVRRAVEEGAWVHTPSRFVADEVVAEFGADPARVRAVHHGVPQRPPPAVAGPDAKAAQALLPEGTRRYVLAVGTVEPRKDYPGLVRAFDELAATHADVALVIAGGDGWGSSGLDEAVSRSPFRGRVVRTGYVEDAVVASLFHGAAVLAFPSVYEGFGFPPLEAMAAGVPVVATAVGAVPEVVGDAAVLVPPADPGALAGGLGRVLDDETLRDGLVSAGRARAASFTWQACAEGLRSLYRAAAT
jgi:glycosyltransferase involved in cell wall biosynthesis